MLAEAARHKRVVGGLTLADLRASEVAAFLQHSEQERKVSIGTRNCRLAALRSFSCFVAERGQGTDVSTRHVAEQLTKTVGQNFYVENRPGADARLGIELLAKAAPDGYTLGIGTAGRHTINPN